MAGSIWGVEVRRVMMAAVQEPRGRPAEDVPLCIDLDGTLIRSDLLFESALAVLQRNPFFLFAFIPWGLSGRARLKREIARRACFDVGTLPYEQRVLDLVRSQAGARAIVLCTAADKQLADKVAEHIGGFSEVMASDGIRNLSGCDKAAALVKRYGNRGFDYAGNERRDLQVWRHARGAIVVNAAAKLTERVSKECEVLQVFKREPAGRLVWIRALRLHQWLKNLLVFLPLLAAHLVLDRQAVGNVVAAYLIFSTCASGVYVLNDLLDLSADRRHPRKRERPFASGQLPLPAGLVAVPVLTIGAFAAATVLSPRFALVLLSYYVLTLAYSLWLKRIVMLDVVLLAALYTVRIIAGTVAIGTGMSFWLLAFSMFLFLSLAMVKRYAELLVMRNDGVDRAQGRGYDIDDLTLVQSLGGASGYLSVLVLALYINSTASAELYREPQVLWLLCPLLLYWVSRVWIVAHRGAMSDDPVLFAMRDRVSLVLLALAALVVLLATW